MAHYSQKQKIKKKKNINMTAYNFGAQAGGLAELTINTEEDYSMPRFKIPNRNVKN